MGGLATPEAYAGGMIPLSIQRWGFGRMEEIAVRWGRRGRLPQHLRIGLEGEREALFHLRSLGYTVVARRWTSQKVRGDLDLIAWKQDVLCFVEVKSRTARDAYPAESAVDEGKRVQLRRLASAYLKGFDERLRSTIRVRFDVVSVYLLAGERGFEVLEDAFGWAEKTEDRSLRN
jgi:putative endonuclease